MTALLFGFPLATPCSNSTLESFMYAVSVTQPVIALEMLIQLAARATALRK